MAGQARGKHSVGYCLSGEPERIKSQPVENELFWKALLKTRSCVAQAILKFTM